MMFFVDRPMALVIAVLLAIALLTIVGVALSGYGNCC